MQGVHIGVFQGFQRLVQIGANIGLEVTNARPVRLGRNKERVFVRVGELRGNDGIRHAFGLEVFRKLLALLVKQVAQTLEKQHAKYVFFVLRGVHVAAQIVTSTEQQAGKLAKSKLGH
ncbi:hypothetical protein GALL_468220 [mine drainage metagenome]|uniref:Uncharacterized protein n=1 Tax=mine drainage metagenome TaxID=410659 RepID=A0A1J5PJ66_9ZZZZ